MQCYIHTDKPAVGACVGCGKFICEECCTEVSGKNYCKACVGELVSNKEKEIDKLENKSTNQQAPQQQQPMVFMNAGGGGGGSSSSSSSSAAAATGGRTRGMPYPQQSILIHIILLFFTAGIGNIFYYLSVRSKQRQWEAMQ